MLWVLESWVIKCRAQKQVRTSDANSINANAKYTSFDMPYCNSLVDIWFGSLISQVSVLRSLFGCCFVEQQVVASFRSTSNDRPAFGIFPLLPSSLWKKECENTNSNLLTLYVDIRSRIEVQVRKVDHDPSRPFCALFCCNNGFVVSKAFGVVLRRNV